MKNLFKNKFNVCIRDLDLTLEREARWLFFGHFWPLLNWVVFFEAAGAVPKMGMCLKSNLQIKLSLSE